MKAADKNAGDLPYVSVVIPTHNRRDALARCLEALVGQTYPSFEVIVVDDGSTDDTPAYLERFATDHPKLAFRWLRNEPNAGANPSRNRGIRAARGEYVAFLDDDCVVGRVWLEELTTGFTSDRVAAVVGRVNSPGPRNIYELTLKGTQRLPPGPAPRLVSCNMCVRQERLLEHLFDEDRATSARRLDGSVDVSVSGRGDEEGLYLQLRAAGYEQLVVAGADVLHEHHHSRRSFFKQAFRGGRSAARLVYKYYLWPRLDMLPFVLAYVALPLILIHPWLALVPALFFAAALAAITYNDLARKGKTVWETVRSYPLLLVYYHLRLLGYVSEAVRLRIAPGRIARVRLNRDDVHTVRRPSRDAP